MRSTHPSGLMQRWATAVPFGALGASCVVAAGFVSAATALAPSKHAAWAVAYLVLAAGVAQIALGGGQAFFGSAPPSPRVIGGELVAWNVGNAAVLGGTLSGVPAVTDCGGALLVVALALFLREVGMARPGWPLRLYRLLMLIVAVSIPVGLILAHVRTG